MDDKTLEFPDGSTYRVIERPADPERDSLLMEFVLAPDCAAPPPHRHPGDQSETFEVLEGEFELLIGRSWRRVAKGEAVVVDSGTVHTFRNRSGAPVRIRNVHAPGHSFEQYLRRLHALVTEHGVTGISPKAIVVIGALWKRHRDTIRPASAPVASVLLLGRLAAPLMRVRVPD